MKKDDEQRQEKIELNMDKWHSYKNVELSSYVPLFNIVFNLLLNISSEEEQDMSKFVIVNK